MKLPSPQSNAEPTPNRGRSQHSLAAFSLAEVCVATAIAAMTVSGIIYGYAQSTKRAEWSAYALAAQALATQRLEQTRACRWDTETGVDQLVATNFPVQTVLLDMPVIGTNGFFATNTTTITVISAAAPQLRMVRVDCTWRFPTTGRVFTNTVATYRSPDA